MTRLSFRLFPSYFWLFRLSLSILTSLHLKVSQASRDMEALYIPRYVRNENDSCGCEIVVIQGYLSDFAA